MAIVNADGLQKMTPFILLSVYRRLDTFPYLLLRIRAIKVTKIQLAFSTSSCAGIYQRVQYHSWKSKIRLAQLFS